MKQIIVIAQSRSGHNFIYEQICAWMPKGITIGKVEGYAPHEITEKLIHDTNHPKEMGPSDDRTYALVIRDFKNWLASYMMWMRKSGDKTVNNKHLKKRIAAWERIAEEAAGLTKFFDVTEKTTISYSRFVDQQHYRIGKCARLGGIFTNGMIKYVPEQGGGSSFDGMKYQWKGSQMTTNNRHEQIRITNIGEWYEEVLNVNQNAQELSRIFE